MTDREILVALARHLRRHDVGAFDDGADQERAYELVDWLADNIHVLKANPWGPSERETA